MRILTINGIFFLIIQPAFSQIGELKRKFNECNSYSIILNKLGCNSKTIEMYQFYYSFNDKSFVLNQKINNGLVNIYPDSFKIVEFENTSRNIDTNYNMNYNQVAKFFKFLEAVKRKKILYDGLVFAGDKTKIYVYNCKSHYEYVISSDYDLVSYLNKK
jgi:hypothetical protein